MSQVLYGHWRDVKLCIWPTAPLAETNRPILYLSVALALLVSAMRMGTGRPATLSSTTLQLGLQSLRLKLLVACYNLMVVTHGTWSSYS